MLDVHRAQSCALLSDAKQSIDSLRALPPRRSNAVMMIALRALRPTIVALLAMIVAACGQARAKGNDTVRPTYDKTTGQLTRLEADSNGDGKIDTWGYMDGTRIVRVEIDENGDGKVDRWEFHKQGQAG